MNGDAGNSTPPTHVIGRPFPPGVSGNYSGRPKWREVSRAMRRLLEGPACEIIKQGRPTEKGTVRLARSLIRRAIQKSDKAAALVLDRTEGAMARPLPLGGGAIVPAIVSNRISMILAWSPEQLAAFLARAPLPSGLDNVGGDLRPDLVPESYAPESESSRLLPPAAPPGDPEKTDD